MLRQALEIATNWVVHVDDRSDYETCIERCPRCAVEKALSASASDWLERHDAKKNSTIDYLQRVVKENENDIRQLGTLLTAALARAESAEAARDSYRALVDAGTAACAEVDARCEALQEKCDGYAAALENSTKEWCDALESVRKDMNDGVEFENPFLAVSARRALATLDDRWTPAAILAARDARIKAEARREALLEAAGECKRDGNLVLAAEFEQMAQAVPNA